MQISRVKFAFLLILPPLVVAANLLLLRENRELRSVLLRARRSLEPPLGVRLPALKGISVEGKPITLEYGGGESGTAIFVLSPRCPLSESSWPDWRILRQDLGSAGFRVAFVDLSGSISQDYVNLHGILDATVIRTLDPRARLDYNLRSTPQLILVGPDGRASRVWTGRLDQKALRDCRRSLVATRGLH